MEAFTFELKTPLLTGGRSQMPLARTEIMSIGLNYYFGLMTFFCEVDIRSTPVATACRAPAGILIPL